MKTAPKMILIGPYGWADGIISRLSPFLDKRPTRISELRYLSLPACRSALLVFPSADHIKAALNTPYGYLLQECYGAECIVMDIG